MTPRLRWSLYAVALTLTLIAVRWTVPDERAGADVVSPVAASPGRDPVRPPLLTASRSAPTGAIDLEHLNRADHKRPAGDPFRVQDWAAADETRERLARPVQPPPPAPAPEAPPLPFTYFGRLVENGTTVVFLNIQDRIATGRVGDTLDRRYRIESIDEQAITFNYLPLDIRQRLAVRGGATPSEVGAASPAGPPPRSVATVRPRRGGEEDDD